MLGRRVDFHPGEHGQLGLRSSVVRSCAKLRPLYRMPVTGARATAWSFEKEGEARRRAVSTNHEKNAVCEHHAVMVNEL